MLGIGERLPAKLNTKMRILFLIVLEVLGTFIYLLNLAVDGHAGFFFITFWQKRHFLSHILQIFHEERQRKKYNVGELFGTTFHLKCNHST